jgi:uncharacterized protein (TIGR00369 family)
VTKTLEARDPGAEARVRASFARQAFMTTLGARLETVAPGEVTIALAFRKELTQQHGFLHAGVVAAVVDSACGYAALTLMPPAVAVLSVEFKLNMLAPAAGDRFVARGRVRKAGRTISVCEGDLRAFADGQGNAEGTLVAIMQGTMMTVRDRPGLTD